MAEGELVTRLRVEGADQVKTALQQMRAGLDEIVRSIPSLQSQFAAATQSAVGMSGALSVIGGAAAAVTSPIGLLVISVGAVVGVMTHMANSAVGLFKEMRELSTVTGGTSADAERLRNTFALAGIGTEKLSFAMFRLGMSIETGGKELEHLGVSIRTASGEMKQTGQVFDEVREKLSQMTSASERAAAAGHLFSMRQARGLMPILSMSAERYAELSAKAERNAAVTNQLMGEVQRHIEVEEDLNQKLEQTRIRFTQIIALPVATKFAEWGLAALEFTKHLVGAGKEFAKSGILYGAWTIAGQEQFAQALTDQLAGVAKKIQDLDAQRIDQHKRMTEAEIKVSIERLRMENQLAAQRLRGEQAIFAEESKMRTGSDVEAIQSRMKMNDQLIALAEERYRRERALAEQRVHAETGGRLTAEEELKLEKERDSAILKLREENSKALVDLEKARAAANQRIAMDEIRALKAQHAERLNFIEQSSKREMARLEMSNLSRREILAKQYELEQQTTEQIRMLKVTEIDDEVARLKQLAALHKDNFAIQREVNQQLMALGVQRAQAEQAADTQIVEERKKMVTELQNLAREEAGIGDTLTNKAIENLRKRGRTSVSEADVMGEAERIRARGRATLGAFGGGGRVGMEALQEALSLRGVMESLTKGGFSIAGAIGQAIMQALAAFTGQRERFMPTGTVRLPAEGGGLSAADRQAMGEFGQGGYGPGPRGVPGPISPYISPREQIAGAPVMGAQLEAMQANIARAGDTAINHLVVRIPTIMEGWFEKVVDGLVRKLEFESART